MPRIEAGDGFAQWTDSVLYTMLCESPDIALALGIEEVAGRPLPAAGFPDFSGDAIERRRDLVRGWALELDRFSHEPERAHDELTEKVIRYVLTRGFQNRFPSEAGFDHEEHLDPVTHLTGVHAAAVEMFARRKIRAGIDALGIELERLAKLPGAIRGACDLLRARRRRGFVAPRLVLDRAVADVHATVIADRNSNPLWGPFAAAVSSCADARSLEGRICVLMEGDVASAYAELLEELEEHRALGREPISVLARRGGDGFYAWRFSGHTTTAMAPETAHELGHRELERLDDALREEFGRMNYPSALPEAFARLSAADAFQAGEAGRAEVLELTRESMETVKRFIRPHFDSWPRADVRVEPLPLQEEGSMHSMYLPAHGEGEANAGVFWLNCGMAALQPRGEAIIMAFHETWPGHHLQLSLAHESSLPAVRRALLFNAYLEGWAKYAESLPEALGFDLPDGARIARLRMELYSTATLVLDTGVHAFGWGFDRAKRFFIERTGADQRLAEMVVLRSAAQPGQLCAYKLGLITFRKIRRALAAARGADFALRDFHELMLGSAALPLELLEERVTKEARG
jgi:uncharacterized protein (DUF885 family)